MGSWLVCDLTHTRLCIGVYHILNSRKNINPDNPTWLGIFCFSLQTGWKKMVLLLLPLSQGILAWTNSYWILTNHCCTWYEWDVLQSWKQMVDSLSTGIFWFNSSISSTRIHKLHANTFPKLPQAIFIVSQVQIPYKAGQTLFVKMPSLMKAAKLYV